MRTAHLLGQSGAQVGAARRDRLEPAELPARRRAAARREQQWRVHCEEHEDVVADVQHGGEREQPLLVVRAEGRPLLGARGGKLGARGGKLSARGGKLGARGGKLGAWGGSLDAWGGKLGCHRSSRVAVPSRRREIQPGSARCS